jgi:voltage-gated potassium channel
MRRAGLTPFSRARSVLAFPHRSHRPPLVRIGYRLAAAVLIVLGSAFVVWLERSAYTDSAGGTLSFLDSLYYATVSLTTTGYGDIVPVTPTARLLTILIITPLRLAFLAILLSTTITALTDQFRREQREHSWRKRMHGHTLVCGYGVQGRSAVRSIVRVEPDSGPRLVILDPVADAVTRATKDGYTAVRGDAREEAVLRRVKAESAKRIVVAVGRDDTSALIVLTLRRLNQHARIVVSVVEAENAPLLRQSGADLVVSSRDSAGSLLGVSAVSPSVGAVAEDLLDLSGGLDLAERPVRPDEVGGAVPAVPHETVLAVVRGGQLLRFSDPQARQLRADDRLVCVIAKDPPA